MSAGLRVFLFFSLGYLVSYLFRGLNIGFGPTLSAELGLSAADLGTLTSLYFLGFALLQIPAGVLLDTWGPRRVNAACWWWPPWAPWSTGCRRACPA
ncbi:transporter, major facilitator domain protein [Bordetella bronchiseptica CARE970018BB]|nr:MFS transporter [Bordetella bronchiseptica]KDB77439.1 transporter, major facilitator domain protein [Bordetella bronchiseptica CARE970018BB]KDC93791.1 transporter, major facilitator domain protein [Bordetella bronchiseptica MBORD670]KDD22454.1 transporter, major facilitator domain protein [Bordetella bronchiseptica MBORD785]KDD31182.1 transporter, major facilitator domain protein [Bordetella bronchiseptica MBORD849]KDS77467.1 membrane transport protein [Bordetella bronchiseptica KM22]